MSWIAVAVGGALGSMARYGVGLFVTRFVTPRWPQAGFPVATLIVNVAGCFAIGALAGLLTADRVAARPYAREFMLVGILGGFTTFSAFGLETINLWRTSTPAMAAMNVAAQIVLGLGAVYLGMIVTSLPGRP